MWGLKNSRIICTRKVWKITREEIESLRLSLQITIYENAFLNILR